MTPRKKKFVPSCKGLRWKLKPEIVARRRAKEAAKKAAKTMAKLKLSGLSLSPALQRAMTNPYNVTVGSLWQNIDPRSWGPRGPRGGSKAGAFLIRVYKVEPPYAYAHWVEPVAPSKFSRIALNMFRESEPRATRVTGGRIGWRRITEEGK